MELLSLEINKNSDLEITRNIKTITNLEERDINIEISSAKEGVIKLRYFTNEEINQKNYLEKIIGKITILLKKYTIHESIEYLEENYFYFEEKEFNNIKRTIEEEIENDIKIQLIIKNKLKEVIENSKTININGFIKFRLKFVGLYASQIVEKCIDNYLMKKEYTDFINIIKCISEAENKEYNKVNIIYNNSKLQVYDDNMKKLNYIGKMEISKELDGDAIKYDEDVISILLSISPKKVLFHIKDENYDEESSNTIELIKKIFEGKYDICTGCKFCELIKV